MKESFSSSTAVMRHERGSARLKLIIVMAVIAVVGYMGFQYVPVAYQAYTFKKFMDTNTENAAANGTWTNDQKGGRLEQQIRASANDYGVPANAKISNRFQNGSLELTVQFTRPVNLLPGFTYNYVFEHTSKSSAFLSAH